MTSKQYYKIVFWFIGISLLLCVLHVLLIQQAKLSLTFGVLGIYAYHLACSLIIILLIRKFVTKLAQNIAWLYFSGIFLKLGVFALIMNGIIFKEHVMTNIEKASTVIPVLLFFTVEAIIVAKIINKSEPQ